MSKRLSEFRNRLERVEHRFETKFRMNTALIRALEFTILNLEQDVSSVRVTRHLWWDVATTTWCSRVDEERPTSRRRLGSDDDCQFYIDRWRVRFHVHHR